MRSVEAARAARRWKTSRDVVRAYLEAPRFTYASVRSSGCNFPGPTRPVPWASRGAPRDPGDASGARGN
jgi:hypothetical protein